MPKMIKIILIRIETRIPPSIKTSLAPDFDLNVSVIILTTPYQARYPPIKSPDFNLVNFLLKISMIIAPNKFREPSYKNVG